MSMRLMSGIPARVVAVLQDYLAAELALIDAEEADGITTPVIASADFHEWDRPLLPAWPAVTINILNSTIDRAYPQGFGNRVNAVHSLEVKAHAAINDADELPLTLQKYATRYAAGIIRVLAITREGLETVADPTRWAQDTTATRVEYGPDTGQATGQQTRTATVTIAVRLIEAR